jgi:hypothetical protein
MDTFFRLAVIFVLAAVVVGIYTGVTESFPAGVLTVLFAGASTASFITSDIRRANQKHIAS